MLKRIFKPGPIVAVLACGYTLCAVAAADTTVISSQLPDLGSPENAALSKNDEYQIGRMILRGMRDQNAVLEDPEVSAYIQQLGSRLGAQTRNDTQNFQYFVVPSPVINAFANPGGFIFVHSGLILLTQDESELASVLGHESGHVTQRHIMRGVLAQSRISLASTAAMLAAIMIGAASGAGGQAMEGAIAVSQAVALQQSINFTRGEEEEADAVGISLLAGAGFRVTAMADFFESMAQGEGISEASTLDMLRDHPVTRDRIAEARVRAAQYDQTQSQVHESSLYPWMRERLRVIVAPAEAHMAAYYAQLRDRRALSDPERYGEALALMQANQPSAAVSELRELLVAHPDITALYGTLGQALEADNQQNAALANFERASRLFPRNVPLAVRYAETLMQSGRPKQAHALLLDLFNNVEPTPEQIRLTALAASAAGDTGDAYYYMAEYQLSGGDLTLASQQLELALAAPDLTTVQRQRFRARLEEIRDALREQQRSHPRSGSGDGR